ncbi:enoyl-CoA hydratase-related protein [Actinomadura rudentiformis]|uniref:enoyl-CoA hydratase n=1 Tax=Actinomadura rudentiformis TaxID=359158 RepID=A0A6H9YAR1_9ACTN|nr:enoyl-CoA hydratase-related protein [Actinomadura rudentiformis]KAB2340013.1 enoyl-CoA hydratase [Actinomadura rudentiformis]
MNVKIEREGRVVTARLHRPEVLNALNTALMEDLVGALAPLDRDPDVGCFVITGSERAFAAGADIREMAPKTPMELLEEDFFSGWEAFAALRTPKLAAVAGHALGGGCELAMMCDVIIAADDARFGQPEIRLGVIPGIGGTQRLTRLVGRARAMDMILTGRTIDAAEAERAGLVSRVVPAGRLRAEAAETATTIASYSKPAVLAAREAVNRAEETSLREGVLFERRLFHALFAGDDQTEGMRAFLEKREPRFTGR